MNRSHLGTVVCVPRLLKRSQYGHQRVSDWIRGEDEFVSSDDFTKGGNQILANSPT